jgi:hypothetical protein
MDLQLLNELQGPEGIRLIIGQVCISPEPKQLQPGLQLQEVQQGGKQRRSSPPADSIGGHGVNSAFEQLHHHRQRCYQ